MTRDQLDAAIADALRPSHFFSRHDPLRFEQAVPERCRWELFRGHLLDSALTRIERDFIAWHLFCGESDEPLLSVKLDEREGQICVVRAVRIRAQEACDEGGIISTRPVRKWLRELVGSIDMRLVRESDHLQRLLQELLTLAVVGTSRLPITSLESPLPRFSLGHFAYAPGRRGAPRAQETWHSDPRLFLETHLPLTTSPAERARVFEFFLRCFKKAAVAGSTRRVFESWQKNWLSADDFAEMTKTLFRQVALTPLTDFIVVWTRFLSKLGEAQYFGPGFICRLMGYMLRHLVRHLTAFDLKTFHNRGANYPDALLLDALLRRFLPLAASPGCRDPFVLRAARMGWLVRRELEGLPVPDQPTSPGENLRVLPPPFEPVSERQLLEPHCRGKRLYEGSPASELLTDDVKGLLAESLDALDQPRELRELGMAVFLDRPLGIFKQPGEVDRTPLLSYEAFSRCIARRRLDDLHRWELLDTERHARLVARLEALVVPGIPVTELTGKERPGVVALEDAQRASPDFVFVSTTRSSLQILLQQYPWAGDAGVGFDLPALKLLIRTPRSRGESTSLLTGYDEALRPRIELGFARSDDPYMELVGVEYLRGGLRIVKLLDEEGKPVATDVKGCWLPTV